MKRPLKPIAIAAAFSLLASCDEAPETAGTGPEAKVVNFYQWSNYTDPTVVPDFEKKTGIKVNFDVFDSNDVLAGKMQAGSTGYDIVLPSNVYFEPLKLAGLFRELDKSLLPNYKNLDPSLMAELKKIDPELKYGVPYLWGTTGLGINLDAVKKRLPGVPLDSWDLLFKPENAAKLKDCGIAILDAPDEIQFITMTYNGWDPESRDEKQIRAAFGTMAKIRPYVRYFHSSQFIDDFANGEVCLVLGWSGDLIQAMKSPKKGLNLTYVIPKEGTNMWFDIMSIPIDAPHPKNAHALINHLLDPDIAARNTNFVGYPSPNAAAKPFIKAKILNNPGVYPPESMRSRIKIDRFPPPKYMRLRNRLWTAVKTGQFKESQGQ